MKQIAGVILAAGASTRFGQPKQLVDWNGLPLVAHVTSLALGAGLEPVVVVLGCLARAVEKALEVNGLHPVRTVMNWRWEEGLSTSVQAGLLALPPDTAAAVFIQCDQPLITPDLLRALAARHDETGSAIVHPAHGGRRRSPTLFARRFFGELAAISGDVGGRGIIERHPDAVSTVEVADPVLLADVDTAADYERLLRYASHTKVSAKPASRSGQAHPGPGPGTAVGRPEAILSNVRNLIVDMDGVLWHGDMPLPGLQEFFHFLRQQRIRFILATNNSSRLPEQYAAKLARLGIQVTPEDILTSSQATAAYLASIASAGTRVYAIGEVGVCRSLERLGFQMSDQDAEYVVVGWDRQLTWEKLATASLLIHSGASFIGTNPDTSYPTERGPVPGNGAQLAAIQTATGVSPLVVGKPEPWMYEEAMRRLGADPAHTAVVGDRVETDIAGGVRAGIATILVLSGIGTAADAAASPVKPDIVCAGIEELVQLWREQLTARPPQR